MVETMYDYVSMTIKMRMLIQMERHDKYLMERQDFNRNVQINYVEILFWVDKHL